MHEVSIMQGALSQAERIAREGGAKRITKIRLKTGSLSGVVRESLDFAFDSLTPGGFAEGAVLEVDWVDAMCLCEDCSREFPFTENGYICPSCGDPSLLLLRGRELELSSIEWI